MKLALIDESMHFLLYFLATNNCFHDHLNDESFNGGFMTEAENVFPWVISIFLHGYGTKIYYHL